MLRGSDLTLNWRPPEAYPAVLNDGEDGRDLLTFPDFSTTLIISGGDTIDEAALAVRRWLRHRALNGQLAPFASDPSAMICSGPIIMIPTAGWDTPTEEVEDGDE